MLIGVCSTVQDFVSFTNRPFLIQGTFRDQRHFEQHDPGQAVGMLNASAGELSLNIRYHCVCHCAVLIGYDRHANNCGDDYML